MASLSAVNPEVREWASRLRLAVVPLGRQLRQQTDGAFTPTELSVIGAIYRHGPLSLSDLAARERLSAPTISKVVAALAEGGVVERLPDGEDRRVCRVRITSGGAQWIEDSRAARDEWLAERIATLSPAEQRTLADAVVLLERFVESD